jgi:septum formation protein
MLYLASQSPRRRELLEQLAATFSVLDVQVPECRAASESPKDYVHRVARDKAQAGLALLGANDRDEAIVIGADTEVVLDGDVFGKPADVDHAIAMLRRLSGRTHEVISSVWLAGAERELGDACISRVASGEPFGKAGAYAIQGRGATLIEHLEGSYSGVMGLPLFETSRLLKNVGIELL